MSQEWEDKTKVGLSPLLRGGSITATFKGDYVLGDKDTMQAFYEFLKREGQTVREPDEALIVTPWTNQTAETPTTLYMVAIADGLAWFKRFRGK